MIDLDLLRAFLAIHRYASVTKAAAVLALSQSALSARLQALEGKLGVALFIRQGRGIRPTPEAHALARAVAPHVDGLETIFDGFRSRGEDIAGPIRIDGAEEFIARFVIPVLGPLIGLGIRPVFSSGHADNRLGKLANDELDLAILTTGSRHPATATGLLHRERFVLVAAARWAALLSDDADAATHRAEVPMLAYAHSMPIIRRYWSEVFGHEPYFAPALVLPDLRALVVAAVAGIGATVVPDYVCQNEREAGQLIQFGPCERVPANDIELAWRQGGRQHPRNLIVRDFILRTAGTSGYVRGSHGSTG